MACRILIRSQADQHLLFLYYMLICGVVVGHDVCSCGVLDEWSNCCIHWHLSYRSVLPHREVYHMITIHTSVLIDWHAREVNNEELETKYEKAASVE